MYSIPYNIWNQISEQYQLRTSWAKRMFSIPNQEALNRALSNEISLLETKNVLPEVSEQFVTLFPMWAESIAILEYLERTPQLYGALLPLDSIEQCIQIALNEGMEPKHIASFRDLMLETLKRTSIQYEIFARKYPVSNTHSIAKSDFISLFEEEDNGIVIYKVIRIFESIVFAKKMSVNGVVVSPYSCTIKDFTLQYLIEKKCLILVDNTNDHELWPRTLEEAIVKLHEYFSAEEIEGIRKITIDVFLEKYNGLSMTIRNYFGLWRGNFELIFDCNQPNLNTDDISEYIAGAFWKRIHDIDNSYQHLSAKERLRDVLKLKEALIRAKLRK